MRSRFRSRPPPPPDAETNGDQCLPSCALWHGIWKTTGLCRGSIFGYAPTIPSTHPLGTPSGASAIMAASRDGTKPATQRFIALKDMVLRVLGLGRCTARSALASGLGAPSGAGALSSWHGRRFCALFPACGHRRMLWPIEAHCDRRQERLVFAWLLIQNSVLVIAIFPSLSHGALLAICMEK